MFRARWVVQPQVAGYPPFAAKAPTAGGRVIRLQVTGCRLQVAGFQVFRMWVQTGSPRYGRVKPCATRGGGWQWRSRIFF